MNKKAQGLPMNTIVIAIIVIVVLVLVLTFFFGGFATLTEKIKAVFYPSISGQEETLAIQACDRYCGNLQLRTYSDVADAQSRISTSSFCNKRPVDLDGDGQVSPNEKEIDCDDLGVLCEISTIQTGEKLLVSCS